MELIVNRLNKCYGTKQVLKDVSYQFKRGTIYSILGRNGAGKTTFFNCLSRQSSYDSGSIFLLEHGIEKAVEYDDIAMVSASPQLPDYLTGYEFVYYFTKLNPDDREKLDIDAYFDLVQIDIPDRHRLIKDYSYGMKNKLQLLCCLVRNPAIILLDEPLSSFDVIVSHQIKNLLLDIKEDHIILMSTHILQLAQDISDKILLLHNCQIQDPHFTDYHSADFENAVIEALEK